MVRQETLELFANIYDTAYRCIIYTHYFEMVDRDIEDRKNKDKENMFWIVVQNTFADEACIYWTHLFGSGTKRNNHLHYKHFFGKTDVLALGQEFSKESVKKRILSVIGYDNEQFDHFWKEVEDCRNIFLAHKKIGKQFIYPDLVVCRKMAEELLEIFKELLEKWLPDDEVQPLYFLNELTDELNILHMYKKRSQHHLYEICLKNYNERDN